MNGDAEQNRAQEFREEKRGDQSGEDAGGGELDGPRENELEDILARGAERDTNADLFVALRDEIGDDVVDAEAGEREREDLADTDEPGAETRRAIDSLMSACMVVTFSRWSAASELPRLME